MIAWPAPLERLRDSFPGARLRLRTAEEILAVSGGAVTEPKGLALVLGPDGTPGYTDPPTFVVGGLFDPAIFGDGSRPGHIVFPEPIAHPLVPAASVSVLPVLPPSLRPMKANWALDQLDELYKRFMASSAKVARYVALGAPGNALDVARKEMARRLEDVFVGGGDRALVPRCLEAGLRAGPFVEALGLAIVE
jgi:hypothetical protein